MNYLVARWPKNKQSHLGMMHSFTHLLLWHAVKTRPQDSTCPTLLDGTHLSRRRGNSRRFHSGPCPLGERIAPIVRHICLPYRARSGCVANAGSDLPTHSHSTVSYFAGGMKPAQLLATIYCPLTHLVMTTCSFVATHLRQLHDLAVTSLTTMRWPII